MTPDTAPPPPAVVPHAVPAPPSPPEPSADGPPDWEHGAADVQCPLCGYNLRGLAEPRCPECGYAFAWRDLLDPRRQKHPYLFEHHLNRPVRSFVRTLVGGLRPRAFWTGLDPLMPSRPVWLAVYWLACLASLALGAVGWLLTVWSTQQRPDLRGYRQLFRVRALPNFSTYWRWDVDLEAVGRGLLWAWAGCAAWCLATLLALFIFEGSIRRARVRRLHVVRCVVYSFDFVAWAGVVLLLAGALDAAFVTSGVWPGPCYLAHAAMLLVVAGPVVVTRRLASAYRHYLRFPHAVGVVVVVQVIVCLIGLVILLNVSRFD